MTTEEIMHEVEMTAIEISRRIEKSRRIREQLREKGADSELLNEWLMNDLDIATMSNDLINLVTK